MSDRSSNPTLRFLQAAACIVILAWGIRATAHLVVVFAMALLLAYGFVPLPNWLMHRFKLGRRAALALTVALLGTASLIGIALLYDSALRMMQKLPEYHEHFTGLYDRILVFLDGHGIHLASFSTAKSTSDQVVEFARRALLQAGSFVGDGLLISALSWIFLVEIVEQAGAKRNTLGEWLAYYGGDVQRYIVISAKTGIVTALANLIILLAAGVDFPFLWCGLYFFLHFIPNVGFILALVPPTCLTLLMLGWKKALLVGGGLVLTQLLADYGLSPILMKKGVHVSFLEIMVSLLFWGFLLGPAGGILAIPLTLSLRKFIEQLSSEAQIESVASG